MIRSKNVHECAICERSIASLCKVLWTRQSNKEKVNADSLPFFLFAICTVESREPIVLCECFEPFCNK